MDKLLVCWKCGASIKDLPLPFARLAECRSCRAPLHVCRMCEFYDPRRANQCREPVADYVQDKERANFCGYFRPRYNAHVSGNSETAQAARAGLENMFGIASGSQDDGGPVSATEHARNKLDELFKK